MQRRSILRAAAAVGMAGLGAARAAAPTLRVMVHSSFSLPKPLLAQFEAQSGVKLAIVKGGDAGEMLNKLILTRAAPVADVVYGLDNTLVAKALQAGVLEATLPEAHGGGGELGAALAPVDYGFVTINVDKAELARRATPLPQRLQDLTQPAYKGWLVTPNPATSSTGFAFLLATIAGLGEEAAFAWWGQMRANGQRVAKGWSEAYYTDFSRNKGTCPLVVSYATSPAAEVFYAKDKPAESPTASLNLSGGVFRQVEGVGLIQGGTQRDAALAFIDFLRAEPAQQALQTSMWMYPSRAGVARAEVMRHAAEPTAFETLPAAAIAEHGAQWVQRWTQVVLKS
ncbi:MAG: thiamine ABC transporter substrate-binding protein [Rhodoferax sp.]